MIKFLLELAPLLIFFATYKYYGLMEATIALMITTPLSLLGYWLVFKKVATMPLVTAVLVLVFGGLTLYFNDSFFIKIKPTIIYILFASGLLGALFFGKSLMKSVLGHSVKMTEAGWFKMSLHWGLFFIALALANELVWRNFSEEAWVQFKTFGVLPLTLIFSAVELIFIRGEILEQPADESGQ